MTTRLIATTGLAAAFLLLAAGCGAQSPGTSGAGQTPDAGASTSHGSGPGSSPGRPCTASSASASPGPAGSGGPGQPVLTGVQFVSASTGWVAGSDRILATSDGGSHWTVQYTGTPAAELTSVDFADARHGWVVGANTILATTDGGAHWITLPEPCEVVRSVHFISPEVGIAVAGGSLAYSDAPAAGGDVLRTTDGGQHWRRLAAPRSVQSACLSDASHGWVGAGGQIYGTRDGGKTWTLAVRGPAVGSGAPGAGVIADVQCAAAGAGWAELIGPGVAMNQEPHVGYHTDGTTWRPIFAEQYFPHQGNRIKASAPGSEPGPFSAVSPSEAVFIDSCAPCSSPTRPQLQGTAPMDIATNGGAALTARGPVSQLAQANGAAFVTIDDGWVVGTQTRYTANGGNPTVVSRIMHTTDGGRSWQVQYVLGP